MMAMLSAAIGIRFEGHGGLARVRDPFGVGSFEFQALEDGYALTSKLAIEDSRVSMRFGQGAIPNVDKRSRLLIYDPDSAPSEDLDAALEMTRQESKFVLVQWGFNGCVPCCELHRVFEENELLCDILSKSSVHLAVDVTKDASRDLLKTYKVEMPGVPRLTILDDGGRVLANVKPAAQFYVGGQLDAEWLQEFLEKWVPSLNERDR